MLGLPSNTNNSLNNAAAFISQNIEVNHLRCTGAVCLIYASVWALSNLLQGHHISCSISTVHRNFQHPQTTLKNVGSCFSVTMPERNIF
ncbi:hypothetical protein XELAEV_18012532mg [Xenopus laevis]|uniref:Uncharacterized protein n=1 Tax=Xenopus laevis TaxID=8355 RepID=A0A974HYI1_XENLA|nr:hypothetical protein XELAEV_18012532mg [Xenopus laevis]